MFRKRLLSKAKQRVMLIRLISFFLVISLLPLLIIGTILDRNIRSSMKEELLAANSQHIQQTASTMEFMIGQISNQFRQLSIDTALKEFENYPRGNYYESLSGEYRSLDLPGLYFYIQTKERLIQTISKLKGSNEYIDSVYMYDSDKEMILTSDKMQFQKNLFYDFDWDKDIQSIQYFPTIMEPRLAKAKDHSYKTVIPMVFVSNTRMLDKSNNYVVVNLDVEALSHAFVSKLELKPGNTFFVLSSSGKMLLQDNDQGLTRHEVVDEAMLTQIDKMGNAGSIEYVARGETVLINVQSSSSLGWKFVTITSLDEVYAAVSRIGDMILITCSILVVAIGLLIFAATRNIYNPIRHLLDFIHHNFESGGKKADSHWSELRLIRGSLEEIMEDRKSLQQKLRESLPANQEKFVYTLLHDHSLSRDEMNEKMAFFELELKFCGIHVWLILIEGFHDLNAGEEDKSLNKLRMINYVEQSLPSDRPNIVMEIVENQIIVLFNGEKSELQEGFKLAELIINTVESKFGIICTVGIAQFCEDIMQLPHSYEQAKEALLYRRMAGSCEVVYIEDVRMTGTPVFNYPKDKEEILIQALINGDLTQSRKILNQMIHDIKSHEGQVYYHQIKHALVQLLNRLVKMANDIRIDLNDLLEEEGNLFNSLNQKNNWFEITSWFDELITKLSNNLVHAVRDKKNRHIEQVLRMIDDNCGETMTLQNVAEQLGLNPSYLSRIFKDEQGVTFLEFLTEVRIARSKQLISQTNLKIKEIGEQVGYYKTNYFIKLFKEHTGLTPGDYRKLTNQLANDLEDNEVG